MAQAPSMKNNRPTCFVSYAHADVDRDLVLYLVDLIREKVPSANILVDQEIRAGEHVSQFMEILGTVDAVVVLLTPGYFDAVSRGRGGAYTEFKSILRRQSALDTHHRRAGGEFIGFEILPILLAGNFADVTPPELRDLLALDFSDVVVSRSTGGGFAVSRHARSQHLRRLARATDTLETISRLKSEQFREERDRLSQELFVNRKAVEKELADILVETTSLKRVSTQSSYFLVGRKGSGKSTIVNTVRARAGAKYKGILRLRAEDLPFGAAYATLDSATVSDARSILPPLSFFYMAWEGFFRMLMVDLLIEKADQLSPQQRAKLGPLRELASEYEGRRSANLHQFHFLSAVEYLEDYLDDLIEESPRDSTDMYAHIHLRWNVEDYSDYLLGESANASLRSIVSDCTKRVLVTLDDFDTVFDEFRRDSTREDAASRSKFERDWIRSLLHMATDAHLGREKEPSIFRQFDYCLTVPADRFLEIVAADRDSYLVQGRITTLLWSGVELCELLVKRLEKLYGCPTDVGSTALQRLEDLLAKFVPELPKMIEFEYNGRQVRIHLFLYVLRHTFWRPRGMLLYFEALLAACEGRRGRGLTSDAVRKIVSVCTSKIVRTEFVEEYRSVVPSIERILGAFRRAPQVLRVEDIHARVQSQTFVLSEGGEDMSIRGKVEVLYDLGFIGVQVDENASERSHMRHPQAFYFNEGSERFRKEYEVGFRETRFVVHPIFTEYLDIDVSGQDFMLRFEWEYLDVMHGVIAAAGFDL